MSEIDLKKQAEELEQTLKKQLELLKKDSENWLKFGGIILAGGLLSAGLVRSLGRKKRKKKSESIPYELGQQNFVAGPAPKKKKKKSFLARLLKRVFMVGIALAKVKIMDELGNLQKDPRGKQ
ncbi:hypothetical protein [Pararhodonellum marinum]|uniref:hypothetical protein n=1 Tax=Pararhodonellum marinum TaxID=2755358 RepID=UPI00188F7601|nr:hypothetical protein [Pararhodonellum marinum]